MSEDARFVCGGVLSRDVLQQFARKSGRSSVQCARIAERRVDPNATLLQFRFPHEAHNGCSRHSVPSNVEVKQSKLPNKRAVLYARVMPR